MSRLVALGIAFVVAAGQAACIPSSVLGVEDREAEPEETKLTWSPASEEDLAGTFISTEVTGEIAGVVRKLVYVFGADGNYTGAALIDEDPPYFDVLKGTWRFEQGALILDDAPPARLEVAQEGSLRLIGDEGTVILRPEAER